MNYKQVKLIGMVSLCLMFMTGLWLVDLGSSALAIEEATGINLMAQTLTIKMTPNQVYHIGLILSGIIFFILSIFFIIEVVKDENRENI